MPGAYTSFEQILFPLERNVWFCIVAIFCIGFLFTHLLKFVNHQTREFILGEGNRMPFTNMFRAFLGGGIQPIPKKNFARFILMVWIIGCIVLTNSYQGSLFKFLHEPKKQPLPETIEELFAKKYTIFANTHWQRLFEGRTELEKM